MFKIIKIIMGVVGIIFAFLVAIAIFVSAPENKSNRQEAPIPPQAVLEAQENNPKASNPKSLSEKHIVGDSWFGATSKKELEEITRYATQKDAQAFKDAMVMGIANKKMTFFKNDEEVFLMDTAVLSGLVKVRRKGETVGYWTYLEAVK